MIPKKACYLVIIFLWIGPSLFSDALMAQKDSLKSHQILLFPVLTKSIETSWSFGVASSSTFKFSKKDTASRTSNIQTIMLYSLKKQFVAAINGAQYFKNERYILNEQMSYSSFPDKFWGLGKHSPDSAEEDYTFQQYYIYLHLMRHLGNNIFAGVLFEYQNLLEVNYKKGGLFDQQQVVGRNGSKISGLGLSLTFDNRTNAFAPNSGSFAQIYFNHFNPIFGSEYLYTNFVIDLRKYISVSSKDVLAFQGYSYSNIGNEIPLRSLATLGGMGSMRGYYDGRYRDRQQLVFQTELRHSFNKRFGAVAFGNIGDVGHNFTDFSLPDLKYTYGAGLRYAINRSEKLNLRLDYGIGPGKNHGLYFELGEAF
ncbi:MAG: BamA/TamA family outer membrane protein [Bacteroidota bacterium]|jgi:Omp85 superfamily domain